MAKRKAKAQPKKRGRGRPTAYEPRYVEEAKRLALLGATDVEMAAFWGVSEQTLNAWKHRHPEFLEALKAGKGTADTEVAQSLYRRALGYSHPAVKIHWDKDGREYRADYIEHYPPDTTAMIFWLKNRRKADWRDKTEHEIAPSEDLAKALEMAWQRSGKPGQN